MLNSPKRWSYRHLTILVLSVLSVAGAGLIWRLRVQALQAETGLHMYWSGQSTCSPLASIRAVQLRQRQQHEVLRLARTTQRIRVDSDVTLFRTTLGDWWAPTTNQTGLQFGLVEHKRMPYGSPKRGDVVLDCGANVGIFTRTALSAGASLVIAIEPVPANIEALRQNFGAEIAGGRVIVYPKGVWNTETVLEMTLYDESPLDSFVMRSRPETKTQTRRLALPLTTIDLLVRELNLPKVDFIKMDIEGAERQALQGAAATLRRFKPRLAIATENLTDDPLVVPRTVEDLMPAYTQRSGTCMQLENGTIAPEIAIFD